MRQVLALGALLALAGPASCVQAETAGSPNPSWLDRPIARIELTGLVRTRPEVITRELSCRVGDSLDWDRLERDRLRLLDLGIFAEVLFQARPDSARQAPVLWIEVRERPTILAYPVVDYTPEDGISWGGYASTINLRGRNERAALSAVGGGRQNLSLAYDTPWLAGRRLGLGAGIYGSRSRDRTDGLIVDQRGAYLSAEPSHGAQIGFPLLAGVERASSRPDPALGPGASASARTDDHRYLQLGALRDSRDSRFRPFTGSKVAISFEPHGGVLGGTTDFQRYGLGLLRVLSTGGGTAFTAASLLEWSRGSVPNYQRVELGGIGSLRGYAQGEFGGESRWNGWVEERFPILPKRTLSLRGGRINLDLTVDGAAFVDGGSIWEGHALEDGRASARWGGGVGLRFLAPWFNLVSLDVATDGRQVRAYGGGGLRF